MCRVGRSGNRRLDARDRIKLIVAAYFMWEARLPTQTRSSHIVLISSANAETGHPEGIEPGGRGS